jgi:cyclopropane fatty-acyl-phospholipid synthase-like methyltransferase
MNEYYRLKDTCRIGLIKYLHNAISLIPVEGQNRILDIGCGTGVPTLYMAEQFTGSITALDTDKSALEFFQDKINQGKYLNTIDIQNISFFDFRAEKNSFDIILAEGFLNVVGFEKGFTRVAELLKPGGYFVIHDEYKDHDKKNVFIAQHHCILINSWYLDETIWWNEYYHGLNNRINEIKDTELSGLFKGDISEIEYYKTDPTQFRSIYYLVQKKI